MPTAIKNTCFALLALAATFSPVFAATHAPLVTKDIQQQLTPNQVLKRLKQGNQRFVNQGMHKIDYIKKAKLTAAGQHPAAIIFSCIDSRVPPEIVFDQAVGNIFVTRIVANVLNADVLGGMEFATKLAGAKLVVVMGHDSCGAVAGACVDAKLGHLSQLLNKIKPAIEQAKKQYGKLECNNPQFIDTAATDNVRNVVSDIKKRSPVLDALIKKGKLKIVGAMYHLSTGKVTFLSDKNS